MDGEGPTDRIAVNILNEQLYITDKGWSSSLVGQGANDCWEYRNNVTKYCAELRTSARLRVCCISGLFHILLSLTTFYIHEVSNNMHAFAKQLHF